MNPSVDIPSWVWMATVVGIAALLLFDFVSHIRMAHVPTLREAATWSALYVGVAVAFGIGLLVLAGPGFGGEYFAAYLAEKALSVDNLFVVLILMTSFRVPELMALFARARELHDNHDLSTQGAPS